MVQSYPAKMFLQDFQLLGAKAASETISSHLAAQADTPQSFQWRFNVFCKTITILSEFKGDEEFLSFLENHSDYTESEILMAVLKAIHLLVIRNMDENLSYRPYWDEVGLTAQLYLGD